MDGKEEGELVRSGEFLTDIRGYEKLLTREQKLLYLGAQDQLAAWQRLYEEYFHIAIDIRGIRLPERKIGFNRLIVVAEGLNPKKIFDKLAERMPARTYIDLGGIESIRKTDKTYAIWVRERQEAYEELKNMSANYLKENNINCITLDERLLYEAIYNKEGLEAEKIPNGFFRKILSGGNRQKKHLDIYNLTLCAGSRYSFGLVPSVHGHGGRLYVYWDSPAHASSCLRSREVVSASA